MVALACKVLFNWGHRLYSRCTAIPYPGIHISAVTTQNKFEALSDRMDDNAPSSSSAPKDFLAKLKESNTNPAKQTTTPRDAIKSKDSSLTRRTNNPSQQSNKLNQSPVAGHKRVSKPPPIIIEGQDSSNTGKLCAEHLKITDFHTKSLSSGKHITYIHNPADYEVVKEALKTVDTTFFIYTKKEKKLQSYLLKGVNVNFTPEQIHEELNKLETSEIQFVRVQSFSTIPSRSNNIVLSILLVQLSPDSQPTRLHSIKFVAYQAVHWEKLKKPETTQCQRCQRLGHTAANCNMNFRCVKCKDNHPPQVSAVFQRVKKKKKEKYIVSTVIVTGNQLLLEDVLK